MFKWLTTRFSQKQQSEAELRQILVRGEDAYWYDTSYQTLSLEGYCKNIIANHCINKIATAVADVPVIVHVNGREIENDQPIAGATSMSISRPNPKQSYNTFMFNSVAYRLISGNTYFHLIKGDIYDTPLQVELFRPDRVRYDVVGGIPKGFFYTVNGIETYYPLDYKTNESDILQVKTFNPLDDLYGLSPIAAAMLAIGQYNQAAIWNKALLQNSSKPSGILTMKDRSDNAATLTKEQLENLSERLNSRVRGAKNAGKAMVVNYDMQWQQLSFSPTDMDWLNGKNSSARDICLAFGYPAMLLGLPEGATFNNVAEAKLALYEETVIPLVNTMLGELSNWLSMMTKLDIKLEPDLDKVSALAPRREVTRNNARLDLGAGLLTINEARAEIGYDEVEGGDEIMVPAGKLPLNFDMSSLDEQKFMQWLVNEGMQINDAQKFARVAFEKK